ncbi:hypothetical protein AcW1_001609 [Taiwanofungus camphoratus]|nr:hypothetical protein AcV5_000349 [Antrodia cinnamomea]KAI0945371.1 hypothetical protein AcW1_001609 [Antrodia cinnamomea]
MQRVKSWRLGFLIVLHMFSTKPALRMFVPLQLSVSERPSAPVPPIASVHRHGNQTYQLSQEAFVLLLFRACTQPHPTHMLPVTRATSTYAEELQPGTFSPGM